MGRLSEDEQKRVDWVLGWIDRMAKKYGGTVYDVSGKTWDWGQALCRECYGENWNDEISRQGVETPSWEDIDRAKRWEAGELPAWFVNKPTVQEDCCPNCGVAFTRGCNCEPYRKEGK